MSANTVISKISQFFSFFSRKLRLSWTAHDYGGGLRSSFQDTAGNSSIVLQRPQTVWIDGHRNNLLWEAAPLISSFEGPYLISQLTRSTMSTISRQSSHTTHQRETVTNSHTELCISYNGIFYLPFF